jgi:uncharacterized integral membrane protein
MGTFGVAKDKGKNTGGANPMDTQVMRARPTGRQILFGILTAALLVFIFTNWDTASVSLFGATLEMPLWLLLGITAAIGYVLGTFTASRRARARAPGK